MKTTKMTKKIALTLSLGMVLIPLVASGGQGNVNKGTSLQDSIYSLPYEELSQQEIDGLTFMVEEEKLARDVYLQLFDDWGLPIFQSISSSEQRHMDALQVILDKYAIANPVELDEEGLFASQVFQDLYETLVLSGNDSQTAALLVGATIEDLDIKDLQDRLLETDNSDIQMIYQNLMKGSRNHLRSFIYQLSLAGVEYEAQYLSPEEVEAIVLDTHERGGGSNGQNQTVFGGSSRGYRGNR